MTSFESVEGVPVDVFQGLPTNSVPLKIKRNQPRQKKTVDHHKSDSSLGAISKRLKVPRSSVQTIVSKYKCHGTTQPSYRSGRRRVLSPRIECTLVRKVQINPRTTAKDLVKMLEE
uniref:Sleeping Beauty transposase HTH domain-containing protein n=1 Tax=Oncorhynchus tshawytscha TaxID=74940 RepID=A0AAZ3NPQ9_ONCTS